MLLARVQAAICDFVVMNTPGMRHTVELKQATGGRYRRTGRIMMAGPGR